MIFFKERHKGYDLLTLSCQNFKMEMPRQPTSSTEEQNESITQDQLDALIRLHERFLQGRIGGRRAVLRNTDISGLSLKDMDLRQADFTGCIMRGSDLSGAHFQEASLYACDLTDANLNNASFVRADMRGARIENASLDSANLESADLRVGGVATDDSYDTGQTVNFRGANLSGAKLMGSLANSADFSDAILAGANVSKADFRGATFDGADLSDAEMNGCQMAGAKLKSTILTGAKMDDLIKSQIDTSEAITDENVGSSLSNLDEPLQKMIEVHRRWVSSSGSQGKQLDLSGYDLRELNSLKEEKLTAIRALNTKFFGMNLYRVEMQSAVLDQSDFRQCDMEKADLRGSSLKGVYMNHARLKEANFDPLLFGAEGAQQRFSPCNLSDSVLRYADFEGARLKSAIFHGADLAFANFTNCDLREADFTGAKYERANFEGANLEGAVFEKSDHKAFSLNSLRQESED